MAFARKVEHLRRDAHRLQGCKKLEAFADIEPVIELPMNHQRRRLEIFCRIARETAAGAVRDFLGFLDIPIQSVCAEDVYGYADEVRSQKPTEEEWKERFDALKTFFEKAFS